MKIIINKIIKVISAILLLTAIINIFSIVISCILKQNDVIVSSIVITIIMQLTFIAISIVNLKVHFKLIIKIILLTIALSIIVTTYYVPIVINKKSYSESNEKWGVYNTGTDIRYKNLYGITLKGERTYHDWHHGNSGTAPLEEKIKEE